MRLPEGMEALVFSYAYYKVNNFDKIVAFFEGVEAAGLFSIEESNPKKGKFSGVFLREYPKNHWNPASKLLGARQIVGGVQIKDSILCIDAKTKGSLAGLRMVVEEPLKDALTFEREKFEDIVQALKHIKE